MLLSNSNYVQSKPLKNKFLTLKILQKLLQMSANFENQCLIQSFADVLQNMCSKKFRNFYRKTPVLECLFNKVTGLKTCNYIKNRLQHSYFPVKFAKFLRVVFFI